MWISPNERREYPAIRLSRSSRGRYENRPGLLSRSETLRERESRKQFPDILFRAKTRDEQGERRRSSFRSRHRARTPRTRLGIYSLGVDRSGGISRKAESGI